MVNVSCLLTKPSMTVFQNTGEVTQCWAIAGSAWKTVAQHEINIWSTFRILRGCSLPVNFSLCSRYICFSFGHTLFTLSGRGLCGYFYKDAFSLACMSSVCLPHPYILRLQVTFAKYRDAYHIYGPLYFNLKPM